MIGKVSNHIDSRSTTVYARLIPLFIILNKLGPDIKVLVRLSTRAKKVFLGVGHKSLELVLSIKIILI
ncbi:MAG: hypothetical protein MTP17_04830 [Candidatus Midichloria sp.]|nr:MAG: hypothetical protein MTP17_04830 [Candidatus Midichloria sp.]